jgi:hypothetical protein
MAFGTAYDRTDSDNDGLDNTGEYQSGTNPYNPDTDGDGLLDGEEVVHTSTKITTEHDLFYDASTEDWLYTTTTDPLNPDSDGDHLLDGEELNAGSNPWDADTDNDQLYDGDEVHTYHSDPTKQDTDGAEGDDFTEVHKGTNPSTIDPLPTTASAATLTPGAFDALNTPPTPLIGASLQMKHGIEAMHKAHTAGTEPTDHTEPAQAPDPPVGRGRVWWDGSWSGCGGVGAGFGRVVPAGRTARSRDGRS